ncbi:MAG: dihydrofolate reductase [Hyphomicrobiaceae bacterium]
MTIALVVAVAENGVIGRGGSLPWRIPTDLKLFRQITMGKPMVMGRKTYRSIGRPLDGRETVVVTHRQDFAPAGVHVARTITRALEIAAGLACRSAADEIAVIGGAEVFAAVLPSAGRIYLTRVHGRPEGDTFWPEVSAQSWQEIERRPLPQSSKDEYSCTLTVLERRA